MNPILECKGLTRKFNHFFALSNVDLTLERGDHRPAWTKRKRKDDSDQTDQRASFTN